MLSEFLSVICASATLEVKPQDQEPSFMDSLKLLQKEMIDVCRRTVLTPVVEMERVEDIVVSISAIRRSRE